MFSYCLIDSGNFQKLEQVGPYRLVRPSPQAVWLPKLDPEIWAKADAHFQRFSGGDGRWEIRNKKMNKSWPIEYGGLRFNIELTDFGHLGLFPEQLMNWQRIRRLCHVGSRDQTEFNVLNLFAYTGGSTLAAAQGGARVAHIDASKTSVQWGRDNAKANELEEHEIRWIVEDVQKFAARELKRNKRYHGIILDPPSFGRGTKNEVWKIETDLIPLLNVLKDLLAPDFSFVLLSSHSNGYTPIAMRNLLSSIVPEAAGRYLAEEMLVAEAGSDRWLPSGASTWFIRDF